MMDFASEMFIYNATILRVVDGDTVDVMVDLGFSIHKKIRVRLYGIDAPESRTRDLAEKKLGLAAKARFKEILDEQDNQVILKSYGLGKYGRCLGELFYLRTEVYENEMPDEDPETVVLKTSINMQLIREGHGVHYHGGKR